MKPLLQAMKERRLYLDGGMGSMLQAAGLPEGLLPDVWGMQNPAAVQGVHRAYLEAGARLITTNTFGTSAPKLAPYGVTVDEVMAAAVANVRQAMQQAGVEDAYVCADLGPSGKLLRPYGDLDFEDAVTLFAETVRAAAKAGADCILIETMSDLYEMKAAVLAAKENCDLPILASLIFDATGKLLTGGSPRAAVGLLEGLGVDVLGINCGLGPKEMAPTFEALWEDASTPLLLQPNAGLPRADGSGYDITPQLYAMQMKPYRELGLFAAGGCCGTTPEFIQLLNGVFADCRPGRPDHPMKSVVCSPMDCVDVDGITVVGERINPTGKKRLQQALRDGDSAYPCTQAVAQAEAGAQVLDVNAGLPGIDEAATLEQLVKDLQAVTDLPLQLDSSNPEALSRALRIYNGKPIVNSVNGEPETLEKILPLCKKYGAAVVGLALDKGGIPPTAEGRFAIAQRIVAAANAAGIPNEDIYIDCLTLTASAQQEGAVQTLEALSRCKRELGVRTVLGVSNISFGLPCRGYLNTTFLTMAMSAGLDLAIMNPNTPEMMAAVRAYRVLTSQDLQSTDYVAAYADVQIQTTQTSKSAATVAEVGAAAPGGDALFEAVRRGLKAEARAAADAALTMREPLDVVNVSLIPALDAVGDGFEKGTVFLPQLLQAATAAQAAFEAIKAKIAASGQAQGSKGKIVIATVKGDVHDIGKNIVRVILENYGYDVLDLGRDVDPERVVEAVRQTGAKLVGLSALMTTTVPNMQATIEALHAAHLDCKVMVGGAVLTPDYARDIGADYYCKDAKASADLAKQLLG